MRWLSSWVLFVVVVLGSVEALARSLTVEQFDARIHVEREGSLLVTETLTVEFEGRWNGLQRFIPLERPGLEGTGELELEVIEVSDGGGEALRFDISHSGVTMALHIHAPAMNERRTIVIHYRVRNGVRHMRSGHAVFWNITGDRWAAPIRHTTAQVSLPFGAQDISANAFVSSSDREHTTVTATIEHGAVATKLRRGLREGDALVLRVQWSGGLAPELSAAAGGSGQMTGTEWILLVLLVGLVPWTAYLALRALGRRRAAPRAAPPQGLAPDQIALITEGRVSQRCLLAELLQLAVQGRLVLTEGSAAIGRRFGVQRVEVPAGAAQCEIRERSFLQLTAKRAGERWAHLDYSIQLSEGLDRIGYRSRLTPLARRWGGRVVPFLSLASLFIGVRVVLRSTDHSLLFPLGAFALPLATAAGGLGLLHTLPWLSRRGRRARREALGFAAFLSERPCEVRDRYHGEAFERLLPYAVAVSAGASLAAAFAGVHLPPLRWYVDADTGAPLEPRQLLLRLDVLLAALPELLKLDEDALGYDATEEGWDRKHDADDLIDDQWTQGTASNSSSSSHPDGGGGGSGF